MLWPVSDRASLVRQPILNTPVSFAENWRLIMLNKTTWDDLGVIRPIPRLKLLPATMPVETSVRIEIEEGIPVFRVATSVQGRIEGLVAKQQEAVLSGAENEELDRYEEIDDFLSFINRLTRNAMIVQPEMDS